MKIKFNDWDCILDLHEYADNNNTVIMLYDAEDYSPITVATVNLGEKLPNNQAYIKDYSENEGMVETLKKVGIIKKIIGYRASGFVKIPLCELDLDIIKNYMLEEI